MTHPQIQHFIQRNNSSWRLFIYPSILASHGRSIDESEDFLDRRLGDVKNIGKVSKQSIQIFENKTELHSLIRKKT